MSALDLDMDDNRVRYSLRTEDTSAAVLTMDPDTGVISTVSSLRQLEGQTVKAVIYGEGITESLDSTRFKFRNYTVNIC